MREYFKRTLFELQDRDKEDVYRYWVHRSVAALIFLITLALLVAKLLKYSMLWVNPGIIILMILSLFMLYYSAKKDLKRSAECLFFFPVPLYFFFFSEQYANIPIFIGAVKVIPLLILSFFLFLLLAADFRQFVIYWSINTLTLIVEMTVNIYCMGESLNKAEFKESGLIGYSALYVGISISLLLFVSVYKMKLGYLSSKIDEMQNARDRYKALLQAIPDIFFVIDKEGTFLDFVAKEEDLKDIVPSEIIGTSIYDYGFSERMTQTIYQCIQNVIEQNSFETIEYALSSPHGMLLFEMRIVRLNTFSVIALSRDISKRKYAERNLEIAKNKAEESDRLKSAFLANMSHEIRTPMNAIIGFSRMLTSSDFGKDEKKEFIDIIIDNGEQLMSMLDDMIDISKVETGQVEVHRSFCKLNDLLGELYSDFLGVKEKKSGSAIDLVQVKGNSNPNFAIYVDSTLLRETYTHLLDNAIKFTEEGEIRFGYQMKENGSIRFFVKDTGIGIPEYQKNEIFMRFHQLNEPGNKIYRGAGLGLSIAKDYVQKLGGQLNVESKVGVGSCFSFVLKIERGEGTLRIV